MYDPLKPQVAPLSEVTKAEAAVAELRKLQRQRGGAGSESSIKLTRLEEASETAKVGGLFHCGAIVMRFWDGL